MAWTYQTTRLRITCFCMFPGLPKKAEENNMSIRQEKNVKQGIDQAATHLKQAVDKVVETSDAGSPRKPKKRAGKPAIR